MITHKTRNWKRGFHLKITTMTCRDSKLHCTHNKIHETSLLWNRISLQPIFGPKPISWNLQPTLGQQRRPLNPQQLAFSRPDLWISSIIVNHQLLSNKLIHICSMNKLWELTKRPWTCLYRLVRLRCSSSPHPKLHSCVITAVMENAAQSTQRNLVTKQLTPKLLTNKRPLRLTTKIKPSRTISQLQATL